MFGRREKSKMAISPRGLSIYAVRPVAPFRQSMGTVVENLFRPSECVADGGSFDSVRLTPHSAHDDSAFFDRRMAISLRGLSIYAIRPVAPFRQSMGNRGRKSLQAVGVRDRRGIVRLRSADASLRSR